ncbi:MAG: FKBP-type peptidyl-prolyl cis-trans isomerase, partial [Luteimonas sp.]
ADTAAKKEDASAPATNKIAGLETDKQQVSYMIGMDLGKSMKPIKDEVDLDTVMKALKTVLADGKPLMTDEQAQQVGQAFGQRMQAKKLAEMQQQAKTNVTEGAAFFAANAKKPGVKTTASGLQYQAITEGTGPKPKAGDTVRVHYKGALLDGKTFDSSYDRGQPVVFALDQVVPGWKEGIQLMPVGSKYKFWIPSKLGYGEAGTPGGPIGPNATLAFDVELLEIVKPGAADAPAPNGSAPAGQMSGGPSGG